MCFACRNGKSKLLHVPILSSKFSSSRRRRLRCGGTSRMQSLQAFQRVMGASLQSEYRTLSCGACSLYRWPQEEEREAKRGTRRRKDWIQTCVLQSHVTKSIQCMLRDSHFPFHQSESAPDSLFQLETSECIFLQFFESNRVLKRHSFFSWLAFLWRRYPHYFVQIFFCRRIPWMLLKQTPYLSSH